MVTLINPPRGGPRPETTRARVLAAAERLLRDGDAGFSMRELAAAAGVSFATPFNQFGSKAGIMQALSARRIDDMAARFRAADPPGDAVDRLLAAVRVAVEVLLDDPNVSRAVIGSLGAPSGTPGAVAAHSRELWAAALAEGDGLDPGLLPLARAHLADQLALVFRGCVSFWAAGEIADADLPARARAATLLALLGFLDPRRRTASFAAGA